MNRILLREGGNQALQGAVEQTTTNLCCTAKKDCLYSRTKHQLCELVFHCLFSFSVFYSSFHGLLDIHSWPDCWVSLPPTLLTTQPQQAYNQYVNDSLQKWPSNFPQEHFNSMPTIQYRKVPMFTKQTQLGSSKRWTSASYQRIDSGLNLTFLLMRLKSFDITRTHKFGCGDYRVVGIISHKITIIQLVTIQSLSLTWY